ncbi:MULTISPECIES: metal ABC transporter ATP-binding protein [unclassified Meiothermus]|uniref:metal ABC transporter ATP-binding protein n=1 Tax=unclassified Meiothermus TaxID=370471 RepID=UPI000D7D0A63|nr:MULTISPECIES: ABC transporter ATP-binding protein [unclassified Meiothermus]PZA06977.1 ABC transporter ATP-binding protein [Meiothermus sp. Pnk-1]RYM38369.1 ABC transporter ATP-binding protein [Meiothermus sp. PNK-Is4]
MVAPAVQVQDLRVRFGDFQALQDVSFAAPQGSFVAIVGPNGAGKSTLLRVLLGLVQPERGRFQLFGKPLAALPPGQVGYVPQVKGFDRSFPALALELVVSGIRRAWPFRVRPAERQTAREALEQVGASHLENRSLGRLSGGELQRVYLARALVHRPRLLLLDEPATGVDAVGEADLYRHLEAYQQRSGATILMITHDWEAAHHHATHVLLLNRRVIGFGPPPQVLCPECLSRAFGHVGHAHLNEALQPRMP